MPDEVQTMFSLRLPPWHGKGTIVQEALTAAEAIEMAGLDWMVELWPITCGGMTIQDHYGVIRMDNYDLLGIVGSKYTPVQNTDLFCFFDPVVEEGAAIYHTGGSLKDGRIVWLLAKLPSHYYVVDDDRIDDYILMATSHNGSLAVTFKHTPIRVVCWNTLSMALYQHATQVQIMHTRNAQYEIAMAHQIMGLATKRSAAIKEALEAMLRVKVTPRFLRGFLKRMFPSVPEKRGEEPSKQAQTRREAVEVLFYSDENNLPGMAGTGYALYNALTGYVQHEWPHRQGTDPLDRTWFGSGESMAWRAANIILRELQDDL